MFHKLSSNHFFHYNMFVIGNYRGWFNPTTTGAGTVSYIYPPADA
ncbi:hypothetical protein [Streptococcus sp. A18]